MRITVNGEPREVEPDITLLDLMRSLGVQPELTAAQHNDDIVDRKTVAALTLADGDSVELIRVVGGG